MCNSCLVTSDLAKRKRRRKKRRTSRKDVQQQKQIQKKKKKSVCAHAQFERLPDIPPPTTITSKVLLLGAVMVVSARLASRRLCRVRWPLNAALLH